jgi:hypothetical protein
LYKPRFLRRTLRLLAACAILLVGIAGLFSSSALAAPLGAVPGWSVTIPAGSTGSIEVSGIALQPGAALPTGTLDLAIQSLAPDAVRTALFYGIDWGYTATEPDQVALAVWWMQNNAWPTGDHTIAQRIADAAASSPGTPSWNPDGRNLLTVVQSGQATIAPLTLTPSAQNPALGSGTLLVTNTGINSVTVYLPYGTLFSNTTGQVLLWASGTGGPEASPTSQSIPTASATPIAPTDTPGLVPPTYTQAPSTKGGGTGQPKATATLAQQDASPTPTARPKISPTLIATDTPTASATPVATDTPEAPPTEAPQATSQADAPQGGDQQNGTQGNDSASAQPNAVQPESVVEGPVLPADTATATPRSGGSNAGDSPSGGPPPLSTTSTNATPAVPQGVSTTVTGAAPPAQSTALVPVAVPSGVVLIPTGVPSHAVPVATATPNKSKGDSDVKPGVTPQKPTPAPTVLKPTPVPTSAPPPAQVLPPNSSNDGGGVVDATSGNGSTKGNASGGKPSTVDGSPPRVNPVTGAGPSSLPLWLGAASVLMLLAGWFLRRAGRKAAAAR